MIYEFTIKLSKHREANGFVYKCTAPKDADLQGLKEKICMDFEQQYKTPCKCVKVREVK